MKQVIDQNGNIVAGLYRNTSGVLVVKNQNEYDRYLREKNRTVAEQDKIKTLEEQVADLQRMVSILLEKSNK